MVEENREILDKLDEIQDHFYNYLFSKTVKDITLAAKLKEKDWDYIHSWEGQKSLLFGRRNFKIEEIYFVMIPFANFVKCAKVQILPYFYDIARLKNVERKWSPQEVSIRKILLDNYKNNIMNLGRLILELYELAVVEDLKEHKNTKPLCLTLPEIKTIEDDLAFTEESLPF